MKKKILLCALSFIAVALFSCGIAFLPNWNPKPSTPPSDIGQEEVTDAKTISCTASIQWTTDLGLDATTSKSLMFDDKVSYTFTSEDGYEYPTELVGAKATLKITTGTVGGEGDDWGTAEATKTKNPASASGYGPNSKWAGMATITYSYNSNYYTASVSGSQTSGSTTETLTNIKSGDVYKQSGFIGVNGDDFNVSATMTLTNPTLVTLYDSYTKSTISLYKGSSYSSTSPGEP